MKTKRTKTAVNRPRLKRASPSSVVDLHCPTIGHNIESDIQELFEQQRAASSKRYKVFEYFYPKYIKGWDHMQLEERIDQALQMKGFSTVEYDRVDMGPVLANNYNLWFIGITA